MPFVGKLVRSLVVAVVLASGVAWILAERTFPLTPAQLQTLRLWLSLGVGLESVAVLLAVLRLSAPIRRAVGRGRAASEPAVVAAALAAHRLPSRVAALLATLGGTTTAALVATLRRQGLAVDLAFAGAALGVAATLFGTITGYSLTAAATARATEDLGPRGDVGASGTLRGKILALALGLEVVILLFLGASGYARHRADVQREDVERTRQWIASAVASGSAELELPRQVVLATGASAALLSPEGTVLARDGGDLPGTAARGAPGTSRVDDPAGWIVRARTPGGSALVAWLPEDVQRDRWRGFWVDLAGTAAVVLAAGAFLAWAGARAVTVPFRSLRRVADRIGAGELTAAAPTISRDEVGRLAEDFRRMSQGLKALVGDVQLASDGVAEVVREVAAVGARVRTGAAGQHGALATVHSAADGMDASAAEISRGMGGVSEYVAATSGAIAELAAAFDDLRARGAELDRAMQGAQRDVEQLAAAGREAEAGVSALQDVAARAGDVLAEARETLASLERAAADSEANAALVADAAQRAGGVVEQTVQGIEALRSAVGDAHRRITVLGRRSDDVDQVVDFIAEVAGRTNLLSLNASIIASQAGEHGKAFAVVADQIRELAAQIARSTKSIGDIIHALREDVQATTALIGRGDALAVEGVQLVRNSLDALGNIQRANEQGREAAYAIGAAVRAHAASSERVTQLLSSAEEGSRSAGAAVELVARTATSLGGVARNVRGLADEVARALDEGSTRGKRHLESIARLRSLAEVVAAVEAQGAAARRVRDAVRTLSDAAGEHESALEGLSGASDRLGARARTLAERVGRFKI